LPLDQWHVTAHPRVGNEPPAGRGLHLTRRHFLYDIDARARPLPSTE
jgi:hypothetical protein